MCRQLQKLRETGLLWTVGSESELWQGDARDRRRVTVPYYAVLRWIGVGCDGFKGGCADGYEEAGVWYKLQGV